MCFAEALNMWCMNIHPTSTIHLFSFNSDLLSINILLDLVAGEGANTSLGRIKTSLKWLHLMMMAFFGKGGGGVFHFLYSRVHILIPFIGDN